MKYASPAALAALTLLASCGEASPSSSMTSPADPVPEPGTPSEAAPETWRASVPGYDMSSPTLRVELPKKLREVSGMVVLEGGVVACVQDERGRVLFFDPSGERASYEAKFAGKGDFEGLCRVEETWFVQRSDGTIFELEEGSDGGEMTLREAATTAVEVPHSEFESIAYDPAGKRLLVAPKDRAETGELSSNEAPIYALPLEDGALAHNTLVGVALVLHAKKLRREAEDKGLPLLIETTKKGKEKSRLALRISDLAVHPKTGHYFVLSGPDRTLLVIDTDGALLGSAVFPAEALPQPEGVAFAPDGTLYLTSEAADLPRATLFAFAYDGD